MKSILIITALILSSPASAFDSFLDHYNETAREEYRARIKAERQRQSRARQKPVVKNEKKKEAKIEVAHHTTNARHCLSAVRVVGSQDIRQTGAEDSAKKAWAEAVRWQHGESYMDILYAEDYKSRCSRSSIGELANQIFQRCEISARPCRQGMTDTKK